jgi:hypothetical protein
VKYLLDLERMRQDTEKLQMAGVSTDVVMKIERTARRWETISSGLGIVFVSVWENVEGPAREAKDSGRIVCKVEDMHIPPTSRDIPNWSEKTKKLLKVVYKILIKKVLPEKCDKRYTYESEIVHFV